MFPPQLQGAYRELGKVCDTERKRGYPNEVLAKAPGKAKPVVVGCPVQQDSL